MAFGERSKLGIELSFEDIRLSTALLSLRLPYYTTVLNHIEDLPADVRHFALSHTKTCDGCRYCVQTDKSGMRPLRAILINETPKCPLYPSFSYQFDTLNADTANMILLLFKCMEAIFEKELEA